MSKPITRPALPADAIGFIGRRKDRPERLAAFKADGTLSNTFSPDQTMDDIREMFFKCALLVDENGIIRYNGHVPG